MGRANRRHNRQIAIVATLCTIVIVVAALMIKARQTTPQSSTVVAGASCTGVR